MIPEKGITLFTRQKRLLALLEVLGGTVGMLDFQKLLFLHCEETGPASGYEFVPYKFGAFSFTSYADRRKLVQHGLIEDDEHTWKLTPAGHKTVNGFRSMAVQLDGFARKHKNLRGDALVADTYRRFPYYGIKSEIAARVLQDDPVALLQIESARPKPGSPGLVTIGYEGRSLEYYLNILLRSGITLLCDVRRNPLSRKYGFSKGTLSKACEGIGIRYEHIPELGIASEQRRSLVTQMDYDRLFKEYERSSLPAQLPAVQRIYAWINQGEKVALTCYEREPRQCHRQRVSNALESQSGTGMMAMHL